MSDSKRAPQRLVGGTEVGDDAGHLAASRFHLTHEVQQQVLRHRSVEVKKQWQTPVAYDRPHHHLLKIAVRSNHLVLSCVVVDDATYLQTVRVGTKLTDNNILCIKFTLIYSYTLI